MERVFPGDPAAEYQGLIDFAETLPEEERVGLLSRVFNEAREMFSPGGLLNPTGPVVEPTPEGLMDASQFGAEMLTPGPGIDEGLRQIGEARESFREGDYLDAFGRGVSGVVQAGADIPQLSIFAGPTARTANRAMLRRAQDLAEEGADRRAIWDETGWFRGRDGKWRFEIDDSGSSITPAASQTRHWDLDDRKIMLPQVIDHDLLYQAYPDTANIRTGGSFLPGHGTHGAYQPGRDAITFQATDPVKGREVMLHELQHGVQAREGFAGGGSPSSMYRTLEDMADQLADNPANSAAFQAERQMRAASYLDLENKLARNPEYIRQTSDWFEFAPFNPGRRGSPEYEATVRDVGQKALRARRDALGDPALIQALRDDPRQLRSIERAAQRDLARYGPVRRDMEKYRDLAAQVRRDPNAAQDAYRNLAGEVEARNVQTRMDMTPDQRRATPPWETQDVPDDLQIVRTGN